MTPSQNSIRTSNTVDFYLERLGLLWQQTVPTINLDGLDGPYTLMNAYDGREPRDDVQPFSPAAKSIPRSRATRMTRTKRRVKTETDYTSRVRGWDDVAFPNDDYDLDADETKLRLECPPGYAFSY